MMLKILSISVFGVFGVLLRYFLDQTITKKFDTPFPIGIFLINLLGCALIGVVYALAQRETFLSQNLRLAIVVGFLGGLTTFSTYSLDLFRLIFMAKNFSVAFAYGVLSPIAGLSFTWLFYNLTNSIMTSK